MIIMKLSKREKIFIGILLAVIVSFLLFNFVIKPQRESVETLKSDRSTKLQELSLLKAEVASESKLYIELLSLEDDVHNKADKFFSNVTQEDVILLMEEFSNTAQLQVPNISFPENRVEELILPDPDAEVDEDGNPIEEVDEDGNPIVVEQTLNEDGEPELPTVELKVHSADLEYEGYYYSFIDFLRVIADYDKKIIVNDITVAKGDDGYLTGTIALDLYSIDNILDSAEELYAWAPNLGYLVGDPFSQFGDYAAMKASSDGDGGSSSGDKDSKDKDGSKGSSSQTASNDSSGSKAGSDFVKNIVDKIQGADKDNNNGSGTDTNGGSTNGSGRPGSSGEVEIIDRGKTVLDFEKKEAMFFVGNNRDITGSLELNKKDKTQGESSLRLKYDFVEKRKHNVANISFNNNVLMKEQPESLSLSVKPLDKSGARLGVVIRDKEGIDYKLPLTEDLDWNGWETLQIELPIDINYPAIIERIYVETEDYYDKLTGDMLIDDLRLIYPNVQE